MTILSLSLLSLTPAKADRVKFCVLFCEVESEAPADTFCQMYSRILLNKSDSTKNLPLTMRKRIASNEVKYRCQCQGWNNPVCKK